MAVHGLIALTSVEAVIRHKLTSYLVPPVGGAIVSYLINTSKLNLEDTTKAGLHHVVRWLIEHGSSKGGPISFRRMRFLLGLKDAAKQGSIAMIRAWELFETDYEAEDIAEVYETAVSCGHLNVLDWMYERGTLSNNIMANVITSIPYSRASVIYWLHDHFSTLRLPISLANVAARRESDSMDLIRWIFARKEHFRIYFKANAMSVAAAKGNLEMLQWLHVHQLGRCCSWALRITAERGHFKVVQWLYYHYRSTSVIDPLDRIVLNGHYEILIWILERIHTFPLRKPPDERCWSSEAISQIANDGRLDVLQLLHRDSADQVALMDAVAGSGFLTLLKWLNAKGAVCSTEAMDEAAFNGHQEVIEWLDSNRDEGCTFNAMDGAASQGHLGVLAWLHIHRLEGCSTVAMNAAAENGLLSIVIWLHVNRSEGCSSDAMDFAAANGFLDVVQWLHLHRSEGCTTEAMDSAAATGGLQMVQWLHFNRSEGCTVKAMDHAATAGHLNMVRWLHLNRSEGCSFDAITGASINGHVEVVKWLYETKSQVCSEHLVIQAAINGHLKLLQWLHTNHPSLLERLPRTIVDPCNLNVFCGYQKTTRTCFRVLLWLSENYPHLFPRSLQPLTSSFALYESWEEALPSSIDRNLDYTA